MRHIIYSIWFIITLVILLSNFLYMKFPYLVERKPLFDTAFLQLHQPVFLKFTNEIKHNTSLSSTGKNKSSPKIDKLCHNMTNKTALLEFLSIGPSLNSTTPPKLPILPKFCTSNRKIFDIFLFSTELDILEIRLYELYDIVDEFHIIESDFDFHGNKFQPLMLTQLEKTDRFKRFKSKIFLHLYTREYAPVFNTTWKFEIAKSKFAVDIARTMPAKSLVILGHVDEIPRRENVYKAKHCDKYKYPLQFGSFMSTGNLRYKYLPDFPAGSEMFSIARPIMAHPHQITELYLYC